MNLIKGKFYKCKSSVSCFGTGARFEAGKRYRFLESGSVLYKFVGENSKPLDFHVNNLEYFFDFSEQPRRNLPEWF